MQQGLQEEDCQLIEQVPNRIAITYDAILLDNTFYVRCAILDLRAMSNLFQCFNYGLNYAVVDASNQNISHLYALCQVLLTIKPVVLTTIKPVVLTTI